MVTSFSQDADKPIDQRLYIPDLLFVSCLHCSRITYKVFLDYLILHIWEAELLVWLRNRPHRASSKCALVQRIYRQNIPPRYLLLIYYLLCYNFPISPFPQKYFLWINSKYHLNVAVLMKTHTQTRAHTHIHRAYNQHVFSTRFGLFTLAYR